MSGRRDRRDTPRKRVAMTAAWWSRVEPLVDGALDLPPSRRRAYYDSIAATDSALAAEVERIVGGDGASDAADAGDRWLARAAAERFTIVRGEDAGAYSLRAELESALGDEYRLGLELAAGGMSRVFLAEDRSRGGTVVVKVLSPDLAAGLNAERFEREIRILSSLRHPNIVPLLAAGRTAHVPYYMMPKVGTRTLRDRIAAGGALPVGDAVAVLLDIARALACAHDRRIVHRDVKPGNVLLSEAGAFVSDFGIAKALIAAGAVRENAAVTQSGVGIGTPAYMSPEQAAGDPATDHRADVYAFGCLAYEVFAGRTPFHGRPIHETIAAHFIETPRKLTHHRPDTPRHITRLVARCLEKRPDERPQSAAELVAALERRTRIGTARSRRR